MRIHQSNSIVIITCWYGPFPWYFPYFVHSCAHNPTIDFVIVTDNKENIANKPGNISLVYKTLDEIRKNASLKLGFSVVIETPYKLCDFKPAYGFLFPELIYGYDFWGHGDIDVVYGNIRAFMTDDVLSNHDVISTRHDYITGTFCLFRNMGEINTLFMQSRDYKKVFSRAEHFCFDECNFLFAELQNGASIFDFPYRIQSMTYIIKKAAEEGKLKPYFDFIIVEGTPGKIKWENGKIIYRDEYEAMFYHLIKFKTGCKRPKVLNPIPGTFYFTPRKIIATEKKSNSN